MRIINVKHRTHFGDYVAFIEGSEVYLGQGNTELEALGNLIKSFPHLFNITYVAKCTECDIRTDKEDPSPTAK